MSHCYRYQGEVIRRTRRTVKLRLDIGFKIYMERDFLVEEDKSGGAEKVTIEVLKTHTRSGGPIYTVKLGPEGSPCYRYYCQVEKIYDGDTVTTALIDIGFGQEFKTTLRLAAINTPELRGSSKQAGIVSRDRLIELILGKRVIIETERDNTGKFGRYLATIYRRRVNVNQLLLDEGLAKPYGS